MAKSIKKLVGQVFARVGERPALPEITDIAVSSDGAMLCQLREGRWVRGRFRYNGEQPTPLGGEGRPQVYGRKGDLQVAVKVDSPSGHGEKGRLQPMDADALRALGFKVPSDDVVELTVLRAPLEISLD